MHHDEQTPGNEITLESDPAGCWKVSSVMLQGQAFKRTWLPPAPLSAPIARMMHGLFWPMIVPSAAETRLASPRAIDRLVRIRVETDEHVFVDLSHVAAYRCRTGGRLKVHLPALLSPTMWMLGHPLPVILHGPGDVVISGAPLAVENGQDVRILVQQMAACDATAPMRAEGGLPAPQLPSVLTDVLGNRTHWVIHKPALAVYLPGARRSRLLPHWLTLIFHLVAVAAIAWAFSRLVSS